MAEPICIILAGI